jgi:hypothetical protein
MSEGIADRSKNQTAIPDELSVMVKTPPPLELKAAPYDTVESDLIPHPPPVETQSVLVTVVPVIPRAEELVEDREHPSMV